MGSRRARRANGRVSRHPVASASIGRAAPSAIAKSNKKAVRQQHKSLRLATARQDRQQHRHHTSPTLHLLLPVVSMSSTRLQQISQTLRVVSDNLSRPFHLLPIDRDALSPREALLATLDAAKVSDSVLLLFDHDATLDPAIFPLLSALRAQGLPVVHAIATGDSARDASLRKLRSRQLSAESLGEAHALRPLSFVTHDNPQQVFTSNLTSLRTLFSKPPHPLSWRSRYGYLRVDAVHPHAIPGATPTADRLVLVGWLRGRGISANNLFHLTGFGSFRVASVVDVRTRQTLSARHDQDAEPVESEAEPDDTMAEQTWPPELPGINDDNNDDNAHDNVMSDAEDDHSAVLTDNVEIRDDEDMSVDADELKSARDAAQDHLEFPDEVDTPLDKPARIRFARYRGLKSLRTSEWDPKEQLPREYASLFQFRDLLATRKQVLGEASALAERALEQGCEKANFALPGRNVFVELMDVSEDLQRRIVQQTEDGKMPVVGCGLLRHENRRSVVHFAVRRVEEGEGEGEGETVEEGQEEAIKAKTDMEMHCGFMRFRGRVMFSENNVNSDKHKMERYLRRGQVTVASLYGPAVFAPAPALLCRVDGEVVATGKALGADPDRIILKRIILTGHPFKTQKRRSVVKFMFFNAEDVRWFKPVELWTKLGRSGHISEALGTHGLMKCMFDNAVLHHDTVCMTLYKRVFPKVSEACQVSGA